MTFFDGSEPEGYKTNEYRGFSYMKQISKKHTIQLCYGYNDKRNPIYGKPKEFPTLESALEVASILGQNEGKNKSDIFDVSLLVSDDSTDPTESAEVQESIDNNIVLENTMKDTSVPVSVSDEIDPDAPFG